MPPVNLKPILNGVRYFDNMGGGGTPVPEIIDMTPNSSSLPSSLLSVTVDVPVDKFQSFYRDY